MIGNKTNKEKKMRKYIHSLLAFTAIVSFASCSSEDNNIAENGDNTKVMTFTATQEDNAPATRTAISSTNNKAIVWKSGDQISVFDGSKNNQFTLKSGEEMNSATFGGTAAASATTYTAVYPYQSGATLSGNSVNNVTLKATQTATEGSFDKTTALMMAQGSSTNLAFKNAVGYVKVTPKFDCKKIELKAADGDVALAGTGTLSYNNGEPTITFTSGTSSTIALVPNGENTITAGTPYYIAVPAVSLKRMWSISFTTLDGTQVYTRKGAKPIEFQRNKIINLGEFNTGDDYWYDEQRGIVKKTQEVDLGLTIEGTGGKQYKVYFAKSNLTATGLATKESDFGDYFAWGAAEPNYKTYTRTVSGSSVTVKVGEWKDDKPNGYNYDPTLSKTYGNDEDFVMADDPARKILGGDWQVPTKTIWNALQAAINANVKIDDINGRKISKIGDSNTYIFLPNAGWFQSKEYKYENFFLYWTGTTGSSGAIESFKFSGAASTSFNPTDRKYGMPIRAVRLFAE